MNIVKCDVLLPKIIRAFLPKHLMHILVGSKEISKIALWHINFQFSVQFEIAGHFLLGS